MLMLIEGKEELGWVYSKYDCVKYSLGRDLMYDCGRVDKELDISSMFQNQLYPTIDELEYFMYVLALFI